MGLIRKAASIVTLGGVSDAGRNGSQAKAARARAARAEAGLAEAEAKVAQEQAAAIARGASTADEMTRKARLLRPTPDVGADLSCLTSGA